MSHAVSGPPEGLRDGTHSADGQPAQAPDRKGRRTLSRAAAFVDQVLSGLSNFLALALIARSATPEDFGRFAVAYALFVALVSLARRLWGTRIAMTGSPAEAVDRSRGLLAATLYAFPVAACVLVLPSLALTGLEAGYSVAVLAVALPLVVAQDLCRYTAVACGRPLVAAASDGLWVVVVAVGYLFRPSMPVALVVWAGGAALALAVALVSLRLRPAWSRGWTALRERHPTSEVAALSTVTSSVATYVTLGLATLSLTAAAAGALRGASTVMAPVNTCFSFIPLAVLPAAYRADPRRHGGIAARLALALVALSVLWGGVLLVLPDGVGQLFLGASWAGTRGVLPWTVLEYAGLAAAVAVTVALQARGQAKVLGAISVTASALVVVAAGVAAAVADSPAVFAAGIAIATVVATGIEIVVYRRTAARAVAGPGSGKRTG